LAGILRNIGSDLRRACARQFLALGAPAPPGWHIGRGGCRGRNVSEL